MNRLMMSALVSAVLLAPTAVWAECEPGETLETVTGRLEYNLEDAAYVDTPYSLVSQGPNYVLYPDGPYFGMKWKEPGFEANAEAKLSGFVGRQVRVTGCTVATNDGKFHNIGNISQVVLA